MLVRPEAAEPTVRLNRFHNKLVLHNLGNSNTHLASIRACDSAIDTCTDLPSVRLYANESWTVPLPEDFSVDQTVLKTRQRYLQHDQRISYHAPTLTASQ